MENAFVYEGERTREIAFPLGGIGAGSISLGGNGRLLDWEIANRPNKGSLNGMSHFAIKAVYPDGTAVARVLHGDLVKDLVGQYAKTPFEGYGFGPRIPTMAGFPHFVRHTFEGTFPLARLAFADPTFPGEPVLTAFNPFIPLEADDSSLPAAFFEVAVTNTADQPLRYTVALTVRNPLEGGSVNRCEEQDGWSLLRFTQADTPEDPLRIGDLAVAAAGGDRSCQEYWYRGSWFDGGTVFWHDFAVAGELRGRIYESPGDGDHGTLTAAVTLAPGETGRLRFLIAWNFPYNRNDWNAPPALRAPWKNHYATRFASAADTARYAMAHWDSLYARTCAFQEALFSSTLPPEVLDAVSANLAVLHSPTVWRLEDGSFYGWEGVHEQMGSCEGSCTHVWNYAYALPFLFPELERSMRENDYRYNAWENGRMSFRLQLPLGRAPDTFHPCVDGQMGGVIKTYRDWKLCGDDDWLRRLWPAVKRALAFAWSPENPDRWDMDRDGVLEGRQHHTLDMELFGPNAWLEGMYLAALLAGAVMADHLGETDAAADYRRLYASGRAYSEAHLFNGAYFDQEVDLGDRGQLEGYAAAVRDYWNEETGEIKYQIADGCGIDQLCGQWHADLCGLGDIFAPDLEARALRSLYDINFKPTMRDFANPCRVFCLNDESGLVICDWPDGARRPVVPVPYAQECMTGFEYEAAGLFFSHGMPEEGRAVVRAIRDRYDGAKRNPFNEIECGSHYARSMASYALVPLLSGFTYDLPHDLIGFDPRLPLPFRCLWSVDSGWGIVRITAEETALCLRGGSLRVQRLRLPYLAGRAVRVQIDGAAVTVVNDDGLLVLAQPLTAAERIVVTAETQA